MEEEFECQICGQTFKSQDELSEHNYTEHYSSCCCGH
ncbi:MAG: C2H2-type zinc finger protein [Candidatus Odinarchaeia archaeon]